MSEGNVDPNLIPGFHIRGVLGRGASGTVYHAVQESLSREVALKVLSGLELGSTTRRRFRREAQVLANLTHPHLVQVFAYFDDPQLSWIALEYLPGGTLRERLRAGDGPGAPLPIPAVERLAHDLFLALDALRAAQLVHRDVKPANVLFRANGEAVLGDLGLVRDFNSDATRLTRDGAVLGTLAYLAPELLTGGSFSEATDRYAAGITLYEALTGRHPTGYKLIPAGFEFRAPAQLRPEAPAPLAELIADLVHPDPHARPGSAGEVLARLKGEPATARVSNRALGRVTGSAAARKRPRRGRKLLAGAVIALLFAAVLAYRVHVGRRPPPPLLTVRAGSVAATVRAPLASPGLMLCVFDGSGKVHQCYDGAVSGGETVFAVDRLLPGSRYRAQLLSRDGGSAAAEVEIRTPIEVRMLGVDTGTPAGLWLSVSPPAHARWAGTPAGSGVDATARRVPIPANLDGAKGSVLELVLEAGETVRVSVSWTAALARTSAAIPLGVAVPALSGTVSERGTRKELVDWLAAARPAWVSVASRPDGGPNFAEAEAQALASRAGASIIYLFSPIAPPQATAWVGELAALDRAPPGQYALGVEPEVLGTVWQTGDRAAVLSTILAWRDLAARRTPPLDLAVPVPMPVMAQPFLHKDDLDWARTLGTLNAADMLAGGYADYWAKLWDALRPKLLAAGMKLAVRWAWIPNAPRGLGIELPVERAGLAISFLTGLARFPGATVFANLYDLTRGQERQVVPAWYELEEVAHRVAGLTFESQVGASGPPPRLQGVEGVSGYTFTGDGRRVQFLFASSSCTARFTPARPGTLTARSARDAKSAPRALTTTEAVEVPLIESVAVYEEFAPVSARCLDGPAAEIVAGP